MQATAGIKFTKPGAHFKGFPCSYSQVTEMDQRKKAPGGDSIDIWTSLTQALTVAQSGASLNASLTLSLTKAFTQALNFKCLLNCPPGSVNDG